MRCHCPMTQTNHHRRVPGGSEPVRPENPASENPGGAGGAHDPMRDDAVDGEELVVPRVPSLPCDSARQSTEHKLTGHMQCTEAGVAIA